MPIVYPTVENPDELLAWPATDGPINRIQIERSDTGGGAGYANVGSVTITAGKRSYTFYDSGDVGDWYRWYFSNAANTFPTSANRVYSTEQQPGSEETGGLLCSLFDARQRLQQHDPTDTAQDENILDWIREVSDFILGLTGRQLTPDPASGTKTYRFHTRAGYTLWVPKGIRSITTLGIATSDQPATGGTYTTATATDYYLDPPEYERTRNWPATRIVFRSNASTRFYNASFGAEVTGAFGWAATPSDIQAIALNLVMAAAREGGASGGDTVTVGIGGERTYERALSTKDWRTLNFYRAQLAA